MAKKIFTIAIVSIFIFSVMGVFMVISAKAEQPLNQPTNTDKTDSVKDRASRGMNNLLYGPVETPSNIDETKTKGTPVDRCSTKTRTGVERGIARVTSGIWQMLTFWYADPGCVTSTKGSGSSASNVK